MAGLSTQGVGAKDGLLEIDMVVGNDDGLLVLASVVGDDVLDDDFDVGLPVGEDVVELCDPVGLLDGAEVNDKGLGPSDPQLTGEQLISSR